VVVLPGSAAAVVMVAWDAVRADDGSTPPGASWLSRIRNLDYETRSNIMTWAIVVSGVRRGEFARPSPPPPVTLLAR